MARTDPLSTLRLPSADSIFGLDYGTMLPQFWR